jgi:hypothetical protein
MAPITDISQLDLTKQYTYADYLTWQFEDRLELIKGWIYKMSPAPKRRHQRIEAKLFSAFFNHLENCSCQVYTDHNQKLGSKIKNGFFVETKSYRNHRHKTSVITIPRRVNEVFFYK